MSKQNALKLLPVISFLNMLQCLKVQFFPDNFMKQPICLYMAFRPLSVIVCTLFMTHVSAKTVGNEQTC